jgi:tetratricopeptide (TPR) repeat protein/DNA-binding CsgD family transcriptional regulator
MTGHRVEYVRAPRAGTASAPRLYYSFRTRGLESPERVAELIEKRRRELRTIGEGSAEAAEILREIGMLLARNGRVGESLETYRRSLNASRKASDHRQSARALEAMGMLHARRGEFDAALECYFDAIGEKADDPMGEAAAWMEIAAVYGETGMQEQAVEALERSIGLLEGPDGSYLQARAHIAIAGIHLAAGRPAAAIDHALRGLVALEAFDDYAGQVEGLLVIGGVYRQLDDLTAAAGYIERAAELARSRAHVPGIIGALLRLAELHRDEGRIEQAIAEADEAIGLAADAGHVDLEWRLHELASDLHERRGDADTALRHCRTFIALRESARDRSRSDRFDRLRVRHEVSALERERDELRTANERLNAELAAKSREMTAATLSLVQKSELLDEVRQQLCALVNASDTYSDAMVQPLLEDIAQNNGVDESWQIFEQQFDQVHRDFMHRLAERFHALTPMELKICTLTRIGLSAKEVGRLLHVSERNVQNHRYRLRKKLSLSSEDNLATFLAGL